MEGNPAATGVSGVLHLKERRAQHELPVSEPSEQCDVVLAGGAHGPRSCVDYSGRKVDKFAATPPGAGDNNHGPARAQDAAAFLQDAGEGGEELVSGGVGEVGGVLAVADARDARPASATCAAPCTWGRTAPVHCAPAWTPCTHPARPHPPLHPPRTTRLLLTWGDAAWLGGGCRASMVVGEAGTTAPRTRPARPRPRTAPVVRPGAHPRPGPRTSPTTTIEVPS